MIAPYLEEPVKALYNTALPKNPNQTYGSVLSPNAIQTLAISSNPNLQTQLLQDGLITAEQIKEIQVIAPKIKERINTYNIPPIPYTLEEREPDIYERMILDKQEKQQRQIDAGLRGNLPADFTPFETKPPIGFEKRQKIASYGIDPDNPYVFADDKTRRTFYIDLALNPRQLSKEQMKFVLDKNNIQGKLEFVKPNDPSLGFRFKPEGSDTFQILRNPRLTADDVYKTIIQEGPAVAGDIAFTIGAAPAGGSKSIAQGILNITKLAGASSTGAVVGDMTRLLFGAAQGRNNLTADEIFKEAGTTGLFAFGGTAAINTVMRIFPVIYKGLAGTAVPAEFMEKLKQLERNAIKQQQGSANQPNVLYGVNPTTTKQINEEIKLLAEKMQAQYKEYNPTLAGNNPLDQEAADLEILFLKNASDPDLQNTYKAIKDGNQDVINNVFRQIGLEFEGAVPPLGVEVSAAVRDQAENVINDYIFAGNKIVNNLLNEFSDNAPKTTTNILGRNTAPDTPQILPKTKTNLEQVRNDYLKQYTDIYNNVLRDPKYADLTANATFTKNTINDFNKIRNNANKLLNVYKKREAVKEIEGVLNESTLRRLAGKKEDGSRFANPEFTLNELEQIRVEMNTVRNESNNVTVRRFAAELEEGLRFAIDKAIYDDVWVNKLGNTRKAKYGVRQQAQIEKYMSENNYGIDIMDAYKNMSDAYGQVKNVILTQLIKSESPEQIIPAILNTNVANSSINTPLSEFLTVLKSAGDDGYLQIQNEMFDYIQRRFFTEGTPTQQIKNYSDFYKQNKGTLKAIYGDEYKTIFNANGIKKVGKELDEIEQKINLLQNTFGVGQNSVNPVYDIVNNIIRASDATRSTGALTADIQFLMNTVKGNDVLEEQIRQLTKNYFLRDVLKLTRNADGIFEVDDAALNRVLYSGLGPEELAGTRLSFEEVFGPLLGKDKKVFTEQLQLVNNLVSREMLTQSDAVTVALAKRDMGIAFPGAKLLQRMLIPPLTQTGRRITALDNRLNARSRNFMGRLLSDPELARRTIQFYDGEISLKTYASFLSAYGTTYTLDMANELKYYDEVSKINNKKTVDEDMIDKINQLVEDYR